MEQGRAARNLRPNGHEPGASGIESTDLEKPSGGGDVIPDVLDVVEPALDQPAFGHPS